MTSVWIRRRPSHRSRLGAIGALLILLPVGSAPVAASHASYAIVAGTGGTIIPGTTALPFAPADDDAVTAVTFPFSVTFGGTAYTTANVSTNGNIQFAGGANVGWSLPGDCLPDPGFGPTAFVYYEDFTIAAAGQGVFVGTIGAAPNRQFVVEWRASHANSGAAVRFEAVFFEGSPLIRYIYGTTGAPGGTAPIVVGAQKAGAGPATAYQCSQTPIPAGTTLDLTLGQIRFEASGTSFTEETGVAIVRIARAGTTEGSVTVDYATSGGSATAGGDYTAASGTLTFDDGEGSEAIFVPVAEDFAVEGPETVTITLSNPRGGAVLGSPSVATLTIVDDEPSATPGTQPGACANPLFGTAGDDVRIGGAFGDSMFGYGGADILRAGAGRDCAYGGDGNDRISGGPDGDVLRGGNDNDTLVGAGGNDRLIGNAGNDTLFGGEGDDDLLGGAGNDSLVAGAGSNVLVGGGGDDAIDARNGTRDVVDCGVGVDTVRAEAIDRINDSAGCEEVLISAPAP